MRVNVCLPLFGNAGHELEEGAPLQAKQLRALADELRERLLKAADIVERVQAGGWSVTTAMYEAFLVNDAIRSQAEAEQQLRSLGVDPAELMIIEEPDEEEELE